MKTNHLSAWDQEEYILQQGADHQTLHHLEECVQCRNAVARLEHSLALFRGAAVKWSSESLAARPAPLRLVPSRRPSVLRWVVAVMVPLVLLLLTLVPFHHLSGPRSARPVAQMSDDALLEQVDEQVSVAVPSSMESLTHLVSTDGNPSAASSGSGSRRLVQTN